jgi:hypothetical protein
MGCKEDLHNSILSPRVLSGKSKPQLKGGVENLSSPVPDKMG